MKIKFIKASNWLLSLTIGAIGFSSCEEGNVDEYGTPSADYIISGRVTDSSDKPIEGIEVSASNSKLKSEENSHIIIGKDVTDSEGKYEIKKTTFPFGGQCYVDFKDIDAELNGSFKTKIDSVKVGSFVGDSGPWYKGKVNMTLDAKLEAVKTEE